MIIIEDNFNGHDDRLAKLEEALFNQAVNGEDTLFEKMAKKIKQHEIYMKTEIENVRNRQEEKYREIDGILFESNQKMHACLSVKDELLRLEGEQRKLQTHVNKYNMETIDQNKQIREMLQEATMGLQK